MKHVLILGATGRIGIQVVRLLKGHEEVRQTIYVRNPSKLSGQDQGGVQLLTGDTLDTAKLTEAMNGQEIVAAAVDGDLLKMAESVVTAAKSAGVKHIIWVTGMGIHKEVPGPVGFMLNLLVKRYPEYVQAADLIADSGICYTLLRCAHLGDGKNDRYVLQKEGERIHSNSVDRCAVAKLITDIIVSEDGFARNASIGVTN